jgi:ClpP class serine protease
MLTNTVHGDQEVPMSIFDLFWIFFIISSLLPAIRKRMLEAARLKLMRDLERERGTRVIALIHRQETMALLGFPIFRYIDIDDSEEVLRAIKLTDDEVPVDLILHTPGGLVLASEQIAHALCRHPAKVTIFVPHYAMSGGTFLALAADEIVMDENAVLGPVDPQLGEYPASSILKVVAQKDVNEVDDKTLILADVARKAIDQVRNRAYEIMAEHLPEERAQELAQVLSEGRWTHDYPITVEEGQELGLPISTDMPELVYKLMTLYRQPSQRRPSVQYIPVPYRPAGEKGGGNEK